MTVKCQNRRACEKKATPKDDSRVGAFLSSFPCRRPTNPSVQITGREELFLDLVLFNSIWQCFPLFDVGRTGKAKLRTFVPMDNPFAEDVGSAITILLDKIMSRQQENLCHVAG